VLLFTGDPQSPQEGDVLWVDYDLHPNLGDLAKIGPEDLAVDAAYQATRAKLLEAAEQGDALALLNMELAADTGLGRHSLENVRGDLVDSTGLHEEYRQAWSEQWPRQAADIGISTEELVQMLAVCDGDVEVMLSLAERISRPSSFLAFYNDSGLGLTIDQAVVLSSLDRSGDPDRARQLVKIFGSPEQAIELVERFGSNYFLEPEELEAKIAMGFSAQQVVQLASVHASDLRLLVELPGADAEQVTELLIAADDGDVARSLAHLLSCVAECLPGVTLQQAQWFAGWWRTTDNPYGLRSLKDIGQLMKYSPDGTIGGLIEYLTGAVRHATGLKAEE
jgi:hypothetical protein